MLSILPIRTNLTFGAKHKTPKERSFIELHPDGSHHVLTSFLREGTSGLCGGPFTFKINITDLKGFSPLKTEVLLDHLVRSEIAKDATPQAEGGARRGFFQDEFQPRRRPETVTLSPEDFQVISRGSEEGMTKLRRFLLHGQEKD
jgi:hypothetical protein